MEGLYPGYIMEKIKLNNQIVLMRKHVKQAKVHSINRLSKEMKLLQNRKGDEIRVMKAKRKAERYLQEISLLKKMKPDCVSKLALSKAKNWKEVLSQKNSALEDRCIAILASYGPVQKEVELFYNSNKDLVPKISELLKQWESKSKCPKDPYQKKKSNFQNNTNILKTKVKESLLNDTTNQSEFADNGNNKSLKEKTDSSLLIKNNLDLKCQEKKNEVSLKQQLNPSVKPPQNSFLTDNKCNKSNNEYLKENEIKIKISEEIENKPKNVLGNNRSELEIEQTNSFADSETKIDHESSNENKTEDESDIENDESEDENADFENDESEDENADFENDESEDENADFENDESEDENAGFEIFVKNKSKSECTEFKDRDSKKLKMSLHSEYNDCAGIEKNPIAENVTSSCLVPAKTDNRGSKSGENKLKAIAMINLDDFRDLDEIPVDNSIENTESSEEEGTNNDSSNTQNDPFFLGRDEAISAENKLVDDLKSNNFVSVNEIFERKEKSNDHHNFTKNFHKPLNSSRFPSKYPPESKGEKNFKTWKKDKVMHNRHQDRFQYKRKSSFDSEDPGYKHQSFKHKNIDRYKNNKKEFTQKTSFESYGYPKQKYSKDLDHVKGDKFSASSKDLHKKSDESGKPLHPSWEAKRKQKEMTNMSFQGKKIVFED